MTTQQLTPSCCFFYIQFSQTFNFTINSILFIIDIVNTSQLKSMRKFYKKGVNIENENNIEIQIANFNYCCDNGGLYFNFRT